LFHSQLPSHVAEEPRLTGFSRYATTALARKSYLTHCGPSQKSAMTERLCTWDDANPNECGKPTEEYLRLYREWGQGGIGTIILGNIPCDRRSSALLACFTCLTALLSCFSGYPEAKRNAVIDPLSPWDAVSAFKPVVDVCKAKGSLVIGQVTHAGRVRPPLGSLCSYSFTFLSKPPRRLQRSPFPHRTCSRRRLEA
jgi:2,4-dienoyl-CoA reductase-like NADH-dependent reductase (Old Yellow Enzyme family)